MNIGSRNRTGAHNRGKAPGINRIDSQIQFERIETPFDSGQTKEIFDFWLRFFGPSDENNRDAYETRAELPHNRDIVYLARLGKRLIGTVHLIISKSDPSLAALGGVLTETEFRGMGLASRLCELARDDFQARGGQAVFLATDNPVAFRAYHRCGWRRLAGAYVMVHTTEAASPEAFLVDYFRQQRPVTVSVGTAAYRVTMIPCIVCPHDWEVMDANTNIFSTRYSLQKSCNGLFPRYEQFTASGKGSWFAASTDQNHVVGLSTARLTEPGVCQVDGFVHPNFHKAWKPLIQETINWAITAEATICSVAVSVEDEEKISMFKSLDLREVGPGEKFDLDERPVQSVRLEKTL